jgi:phosphohistidine phosphatase
MSMLRLMLLRHAKSSWTDPGRDDRDRPLSPRGIKAAPAIGAYMRKEKLFPDLVLCSPARRARDTWTLAAEALKAAPKLIVDDAIYDFGNGGRLLDSLRHKGNGAKSVLLVGHNPSLERLALRLVGKSDKTLKDRIAKKYPTGALAVIDFKAADWKAVKDTEGFLISFTRPKDLLPKES